MQLTTDEPDCGSETDLGRAGMLLPAPVAWDALRSDAGILAMLVEPNGLVTFANAAWHQLLRESQPSGRLMAEVLGEPMALEIRILVERIVTDSYPESILSMVRGTLLRVTLRPTYSRADGSCPGVLISSCAVREEMLLEGIPLATCHDLGSLGVLTERELELLYHIGKGRDSRTAAGLIHRSIRTTEWHRASLGEKLGCSNRVQLARVAIASGITAVKLETLVALYRAAKPRRTRSLQTPQARANRSPEGRLVAALASHRPEVDQLGTRGKRSCAPAAGVIPRLLTEPA